MIRLSFKRWKLEVEEVQAAKMDNDTIDVVISGSFPAGWAWTLKVRHMYDINAIILEQREPGVYGHTFAAEEIPFAGEYELNLQGQNGVKTRSTNIVKVMLTDIIDGDEAWPEVPSAFEQAVRDAATAKVDAEAARNAAESARDEAVATVEEISGDIERILEVIPDQATAENKLADKAFVNSSIGTNTAYYISNNGQPFASLAALEAYTGTVTNNDYAFVVGQDQYGNTTYTRYKYNADEGEWAAEYILNNSSFTAVQWAAINSGITDLLVQKITDFDPDDFVTVQQLNAKYTKPTTGIPKTDLAQAVKNSLDLADSALQSHQSLAAYRTAAAQDLIDNGKVSTADYAPVAKTAEMTQDVGKGTDGKLYTKPTGSGGTGDHSQLTNRDAADQHPISAITGLEDALNEIPTEQTVSGWGFTKNVGTYIKPSSGIPKSDLAQEVQDSLTLADSALQSHQSLAAYRTAAEQDLIDGSKYSKPSSGIPKSDLVQAVQTSLGKADDAQPKAIGVEYAGDFLVVGTDGNITHMSMAAWQGGSY